MAPVGSRESLAAAINAGADSIYFGIENLNMRARSANTFTIDDLREIAATCDEHGIKSYLTINTIIYDEDITLMRTIVDAAYEAGARTILAWSYRGGESNTYKAEHCDVAWQRICEGMQRVRQRHFDAILEENKKMTKNYPNPSSFSLFWLLKLIFYTQYN